MIVGLENTFSRYALDTAPTAAKPRQHCSFIISIRDVLSYALERKKTDWWTDRQTDIRSDRRALSIKGPFNHQITPLGVKRADLKENTRISKYALATDEKKAVIGRKNAENGPRTETLTPIEIKTCL